MRRERGMKVDINLVDLLLKRWGAWRNDSGYIRKLTGLGQGHIKQAGPRSNLGRLVVKGNVEVIDREPMPLDSDEDMLLVEMAVNSLSERPRRVVSAQYRGHGNQEVRAFSLGISHIAYRVALHRGKVGVMVYLNNRGN